jgi:hypothetical protein
MDKLELDDRVSRLEHRMSLLTALILTVLLLVGISAAFLLVARKEAFISPLPVASMVMTERIAPDPIVPPAAQPIRSMTDLDAEIRKADGLRSGGLINPEDFTAKKALMISDN